eukprot:TRINITY_DN33601_c0_g1_i1.p1 TRINITY_DN33601_c0_g1~~TRINITY_DN33601_c0_g1_i1.p1  ORF type:complete len:638 (+),score=145.00 TRINITY_DN33601_c0_g1_i1:56-1969(+)
MTATPSSEASARPRAPSAAAPDPPAQPVVRADSGGGTVQARRRLVILSLPLIVICGAAWQHPPLAVLAPIPGDDAASRCPWQVRRCPPGANVGCNIPGAKYWEGCGPGPGGKCSNRGQRCWQTSAVLARALCAALPDGECGGVTKDACGWEPRPPGEAMHHEAATELHTMRCSEPIPTASAAVPATAAPPPRPTPRLGSLVSLPDDWGPAVVAAGGTEGRVVAMLTTCRALPLADWWLHNAGVVLQRGSGWGGGEPTGVILGGTDNRSLAWAERRGVRRVDVRSICPWLSTAQTASRDFRKASGTLGAMHCKPVFLYALLASGVEAMLLDTDVLMLRDPWQVLATTPRPGLALQCGERAKIDYAFKVWPNTGIVAGSPTVGARFAEMWAAELVWWQRALAASDPNEAGPRPYLRGRPVLRHWMLQKRVKGWGVSSHESRHRIAAKLIAEHDAGRLTLAALEKILRGICPRMSAVEVEGTHNVSMVCPMKPHGVRWTLGPFAAAEWNSRDRTAVPQRLLHKVSLREDCYDGSDTTDQEIARELLHFADLSPPETAPFRCIGVPHWTFPHHLPKDDAGRAAAVDRASLIHVTGRFVYRGVAKPIRQGWMNEKFDAMRVLGLVAPGAPQTPPPEACGDAK